MDLSAWENLEGASAMSSIMSQAASKLHNVLHGSGESSDEKQDAVLFDKDGPSDEIWILGNRYVLKEDFNLIRKELQTRLWFSYRRDFPPIGDSGMTSDKGWGCMLRCGQMVLAECLARQVLGRDFRWSRSESSPQYLSLLPMFADDRSAIYSVHQLSMVSSDQKPIGTWFGPNTVAHAIKKMAVYDPEQRLAVAVAMNNVLVVSDVVSTCKTPILNSSWQPLLLFIPLRLGITDINPTYFEPLKKCFELEQTVGVIGGRPNHALFFVGYSGDELICLDPHETQASVSVGSKVDPDEEEADETYHTDESYRWHMNKLDPSLALCFYCQTEASFHELIRSFRDVINDKSNAMFEVHDRPPSDEISPKDAEAVLENSDDEFEML